MHGSAAPAPIGAHAVKHRRVRACCAPQAESSDDDSSEEEESSDDDSSEDEAPKASAPCTREHACHGRPCSKGRPAAYPAAF